MAQTNGYQIDLSNLIYHANVNTDSIVPTRELIVRRVFCFFGGMEHWIGVEWIGAPFPIGTSFRFKRKTILKGKE